MTMRRSGCAARAESTRSCPEPGQPMTNRGSGRPSLGADRAQSAVTAGSMAVVGSTPLPSKSASTVRTSAWRLARAAYCPAASG